jgi:restriction system protein
MAIPDYQTLMLPVLRLASKGEQRVADVAESVANEFGLTAEERETLLPSGRQRVLNNRIHWAKFYMSKAGLISSPGRGRFAATEDIDGGRTRARTLDPLIMRQMFSRTMCVVMKGRGAE